jgi:hypothetical protein
MIFDDFINELDQRTHPDDNLAGTIGNYEIVCDVGSEFDIAAIRWNHSTKKIIIECVPF